MQGNLIRNLLPRATARQAIPTTPRSASASKPTRSVTGNVIENVKGIGIQAGWGPYLRDVTVTANVVRGADYGIAVSVAPAPARP